MGNLYGYIRVSTREQNEDRQILALKELSIPEKNLFKIWLAGYTRTGSWRGQNIYPQRLYARPRSVLF